MARPRNQRNIRAAQSAQSATPSSDAGTTPNPADSSAEARPRLQPAEAGSPPAPAGDGLLGLWLGLIGAIPKLKTGFQLVGFIFLLACFVAYRAVTQAQVPGVIAAGGIGVVLLIFGSLLWLVDRGRLPGTSDFIIKMFVIFCAFLIILFFISVYYLRSPQSGERESTGESRKPENSVQVQATKKDFVAQKPLVSSTLIQNVTIQQIVINVNTTHDDKDANSTILFQVLQDGELVGQAKSGDGEEWQFGTQKRIQIPLSRNISGANLKLRVQKLDAGGGRGYPWSATLEAALGIAYKQETTLHLIPHLAAIRLIGGEEATIDLVPPRAEDLIVPENNQINRSKNEEIEYFEIIADNGNDEKDKGFSLRIDLYAGEKLVASGEFGKGETADAWKSVIRLLPMRTVGTAITGEKGRLEVIVSGEEVLWDTSLQLRYKPKFGDIKVALQTKRFKMSIAERKKVFEFTW